MCLLIQVQSILYFAGKFFTTQEARFSYIPSVRSTGLEEKNPSAEMTWPSYYLPTVSNWSTCPFFYPHGSGGNAIELVVMVIKCFSRVFSFFFFFFWKQKLGLSEGLFVSLPFGGELFPPPSPGPRLHSPPRVFTELPTWG